MLTGKAAAAGRLNMTWYRSDEDLPDMNDYDIIQGKRTYQFFLLRRKYNRGAVNFLFLLMTGLQPMTAIT